jgi:digeranylgeranylglycerophospholipid reductase
MNKAYDVIVVGAGPAGSLAAKHAALGGVSTLLIEKHPVIGCPVCCAEAISTTGLTNIVEPIPAGFVRKSSESAFTNPVIPKPVSIILKRICS